MQSEFSVVIHEDLHRLNRREIKQLIYDFRSLKVDKFLHIQKITLNLVSRQYQYSLLRDHQIVIIFSLNGAYILAEFAADRTNGFVESGREHHHLLLVRSGLGQTQNKKL